ncbi:Ger(x)C family germination protein [Paenibacillus sp. BK720]|nr:Ger(x)C family germination protein [Paenibacillus sp. BK720]
MVVTLSGCAFEDIDRRAFVTSIGLDPSEDKDKKYTVILKVSMSKGDPKNIGSEFLLLKVNCNSISEGLERLRSMSDKKLEYGHVKVLLFGEEVARKDISLAVDYFMRRPDIQKIAYLSVGKPNSYELLKYKPKEEAVAGSYFFYTFERSRKQSPFVYAVPLYDASRRITTSGLDLTMPVVTYEHDALQINRIALFDKKQMKEELTSEESRLLKLLISGVHNDTLTLKTPNGDYSVTSEEGSAGFKLIAGQGHGKPMAVFSIRMRGALIEKLDDSAVISDDVKLALAKQAEEQIKSKAQQLLVKLRDERLDPLGLGLRYRARHFDHSNDLRTWSTLYPELEFQVNVKYKFKED